jgi:tRNA-splicing ligase RtcB
MDWCLRFARENRRLMSEAVQAALSRRFANVEPDAALDVHHNYAAVEEHFGRQVVVHRKGAVRAQGTVIVPGSMGTASYIGTGTQNPDAFESCSHGAGRAMGRKAAVRALPRQHVLDELERAGVRLLTHSVRDVAEEAPEAYKDIEQVMGWQTDLVEPRIRLVPIGVVKG